MEDIIQEKISADHLLYVSLKYTKTCDVIMNLLLRWRELIKTCNSHILEKHQKLGNISTVSENAVGKIRQMKELYGDDKNMIELLNFFMMLRKLEGLQTERVGEFRKNVALRIQFKGDVVNVNLEQLKIYAELLENFMKTVKEFLIEK